ncbi:unnamed protein product [Blepharisma stoltei]|uniref:Kelch repeat-containing protein n=1 Tax=Blepharisma stoltei TaxID=1481888 RepID=A0AAU9IL50_9CILI|nr:unnamed protein product [Blepharisma stoltei]
MHSRIIERLENSDSGNTSTEDLLIINNLATSLDTTQMPIAIRVPHPRSFLDESSSEEVSERLIRTFNQDVIRIDETLESLLEKTFSEGSQSNSFLADITSQSWKMQTYSISIDDGNSSIVFNAYSFNDISQPKSPKINSPKHEGADTLREEVYFEQPFTLITLRNNELYLYHMINDREDHIELPTNIMTHSACVLPDGQIIATDDGSIPNSTFRYQNSAGWAYISELIYPRNGHSMIFHKGTVYVIGGLYNGKLRNEVERLNKNDSWEEIPSLHNPRQNPACVSMESKLYVTGGICEVPDFAFIEVLIGKTWKILDVKIEGNLHGHACFFTPEHKLVVLGGVKGDSPACHIAMITDEDGVVNEGFIECQDSFPLNSWSYIEEEGSIIAWGTQALWKFDILTTSLKIQQIFPLM